MNNIKKILELLKKKSVCTIATSSQDKPRASVMEYYLINDSIILATSPRSIKANNLKVNKQISISIWSAPELVTIDGTVTTPSKEEIDRYNSRLLDSHPEFAQMVESGIMEPFIYFKVCMKTIYYTNSSTNMTQPEVIEL